MNASKVFAADALAGEVVLLTGASRGIGRAILDQLAAAGATVIGTATGSAGAQAIDERLTAGGLPAETRVEEHHRAGLHAGLEQAEHLAA